MAEGFTDLRGQNMQIFLEIKRAESRDGRMASERKKQRILRMGSSGPCVAAVREAPCRRARRRPSGGNEKFHQPRFVRDNKNVEIVLRGWETRMGKKTIGTPSYFPCDLGDRLCIRDLGLLSCSRTSVLGIFGPEWLWQIHLAQRSFAGHYRAGTRCGRWSDDTNQSGIFFQGSSRIRTEAQDHEYLKEPKRVIDYIKVVAGILSRRMDGLISGSFETSGAVFLIWTRRCPVCADQRSFPVGEKKRLYLL